MSHDQSKINSYPFYEFHHDHHPTMLSEGFAFPIVTDHTTYFNPFVQYNHLQQPPPQFDFDHLNGALGYNTLSAGLDSPSFCNNDSYSNEAAAAAAGTSTTSGGGGGDNIPLTPNSSVSFSSQDAGAEEDSSKSKKDVQANAGEGGDGKSKNAKAKEKEGKRPKQARFAFMTKSEVDNLEDGYRWRKYGQKAVKNSSFPRSYYRCTSQKCSVKKRIERSHQDPSVVITTYEGQHNHHSPAVLRGSAAAMLAPSLFSTPQDMFFPTSNQRNFTNPSTFPFYTELTNSNHPSPPQPPEIADQYNFVMPGPSFLYKPGP